MSSAPARGTRPANRRDLILTAATDLFATRGYENVNVADVAERVAVGPSALYRHFRGKEALLEAVVDQAGVRLLAATEADPDLSTTVRDLAGAALDNRALGMLWRREARHLPAEPRFALESRFEQVRRGLADRLVELDHVAPAGHRHLVATGILGVLLSPSFHRVQLPRERFVGLLTDTALRVLAEPPAPGPGEAVVDRVRPSLGRTVRREVVLRVALGLFAERTYASVGMNDIAAAAGLATSTVYLDFPSKADLLATALHRGNGYLQVELDRALDESEDESEALRRLVASYCRFAFAHPALVDLLITETRTLPEPERVAVTQAQRDYVHEWARLYRAVRPELDQDASTVVVQGVLQLMNDLARFPTSRSTIGAETAGRLAVAGLLGG